MHCEYDPIIKGRCGPTSRCDECRQSTVCESSTVDMSAELRVSRLRVRELKRRLRSLGVDDSGCVEKHELVRLLLMYDPSGAVGAAAELPSASRRQSRKKQKKESRREAARQKAAAAIDLTGDDEELALQRALAMSMRDVAAPSPASGRGAGDLVDLTALSDSDVCDEATEEDDLTIAMAASFGMSVEGFKQQRAEMSQYQSQQDARDGARLQALEGLSPELQVAATSEYDLEVAKQKVHGGSLPKWEWAVGLAKDKQRALEQCAASDAAGAVARTPGRKAAAAAAPPAAAEAAHAVPLLAASAAATAVPPAPSVLPAEPPVGAGAAITLRLRLLSGRQVRRRFFSDAKVRDVVAIACVLCGADGGGGGSMPRAASLRLTTNFPRTVLVDVDKTLAELGIASRTALTVEQVDGAA